MGGYMNKKYRLLIKYWWYRLTLRTPGVAFCNDVYEINSSKDLSIKGNWITIVPNKTNGDKCNISKRVFSMYTDYVDIIKSPY